MSYFLGSFRQFFLPFFHSTIDWFVLFALFLKPGRVYFCFNINTKMYKEVVYDGRSIEKSSGKLPEIG